MASMIYSPLLPSSHCVNLDISLASNAYEKRRQSISAGDTYNFNHSDNAGDKMPSAKKPIRRYKAQSHTQNHRYRTMSHDGRPNPQLEPNANPPPRQRPIRYNSD